MIIHTPTPDLNQSIEFYEKLGFDILKNGNQTFAIAGNLIIEINENPYARAGIKLFNADWSAVVSKLKNETSVIEADGNFLLSDPSGVYIYLETGKVDLEHKSSQASKCLLGNYAGISLETTSISNSALIYEILGFSPSMGSADQGWVSLTNKDGMAISLMRPNSCPHLFFNPSLTFFNGGNNPQIIQGIRQAGISIAEEITHFNKEGIVDNIIVRDPGGYGFFVFND